MAQGRLCRITVIRKDVRPDIAETFGYGGKVLPCEKFEVGQEFILDQNGTKGFWHLMNGEFCSEAWAAIGHYVDLVLQGGTFDAGFPTNMTVACCPNGLHPVTFKIELV